MSETDNSLIFNLAAHFAKRNTKNCGGEKRSGESEGGQKFLPPNPLPFARPSVQFWFYSACGGAISRDFVQNGFGFRPTNTTKVYLQRDLPRSGRRKSPKNLTLRRVL